MVRGDNEGSKEEEQKKGGISLCARKTVTWKIIIAIKN